MGREPGRQTADAVEREVAGRLEPTPAFVARVAQVRDELPEKVRQVARERGSPLVRALIAGSAARGTYLADRLDIDLFLLFPPDLPRDRLKEEGMALGRAVLTDPTTRYAEHPYLRGRYYGFAVDAVPGYAVTDPSRPLSPVDRTPFHQEYLTARERPAHVREIRLAKQFLRTLGVYGSEAKTEGFSGYLLELLILQFGSLRSLLSAAQAWQVPVRLAAPGAEPPRLPEDVALILADPVDPHRNVATALSRRNLALTILAAGAYLRDPTREWFEPQVRPPLELSEALALTRRRDSHVCVVLRARPELVDDTLLPQLRKAERAIAEELTRSEFVLLGSASSTDEHQVCVTVELAIGTRPAVRLRDGPPAGIDRVGSFLEKWGPPQGSVLQGPYLREDGRLAVETQTDLRDPEEFLRSILPRLSLGKNLGSESPTTFHVSSLESTGASPAVAEALTALLRKRLPWLAPPPAL